MFFLCHISPLSGEFTGAKDLHLPESTQLASVLSRSNNLTLVSLTMMEIFPGSYSTRRPGLPQERCAEFLILEAMMETQRPR